MISRTPARHSNFSVNGKQIQQVIKFRYLSSWITEDLHLDMEVQRSIQQARTSVTRVINSLKCYVYSVLLYGVETGNLIKNNTMNSLKVKCYLGD